MLLHVEKKTKDLPRVYLLVHYDLFSLLGHFQIHRLPTELFDLYLGIYGHLIEECSDEAHSDWVFINADYLSKIFGVFCMGLMNYHHLRTAQVPKLLALVEKLCLMYALTPVFLESWFPFQSDPDIMFYLHKTRIPGTIPLSGGPQYLPIYELLKEFLFIDGFYATAQSGIVSLCQVTGSSAMLQAWFQKCDFPEVILTCLVSGFNQVCYSDYCFPALNHNLHTFVPASNPNLARHLENLNFVVELQSSVHESSLVCRTILDCMRHEYTEAIVGYFHAAFDYQEPILALACSSITYLCEIPGGERIAMAQLNSKEFQAVITESMARGNVVTSTAVLKMLNTIVRYCSEEVVQSVFCHDNIIPSLPRGCSSFVTRNVIRLTQSENIPHSQVANHLKVSRKRIERLKGKRDGFSAGILVFDEDALFGVITKFCLARFFFNHILVNVELVELILNMLCYKQGSILNFLTQGCDGATETFLCESPFSLRTHETCVSFQITTYLYDSYVHYKPTLGEHPISDSTPIRHAVHIPPPESVLNKFNQILINAATKPLVDGINKWGDADSGESLQSNLPLNLKLFNTFYLNFYCCTKLLALMSVSSAL
ncbi:hypothetical protein BABINDRAFT_166636 [Babjeviella inositovora NRRL Y-12698]|uniref:Uncharacterized protein n=1 Tax=Babjeviella inositovora NRRL Y-12698 TaxID=984486 RepID=A0A1E3QRM4_9ASCO|nr:uncharacterized protein BABINDRAFT_166636 [Babjeviella inositovora NRRL Y-12698]ODQ80288.1 hypothetical protein BABINDRAFT_166636 [Babjeviella inositovora NRRL Y-12698]